jgi:hypothetical protein
MSRSFWLGIGSGMAVAAFVSLANTFVAISRGLVYPLDGTVLKITGGVTFVLGIVVGMLGARFARPATVASSQRAAYTKMAKKLGEEVVGVMLKAIVGFFLALAVLHPLLTFAFQITQGIP